ncbi:MAG TPA: sulfate adenylyltransferase subunit CysD [Alphaproteobacteria bacterium]|jgi:sulfate adenylyltransferase subunit 2|nr:MAG: Sulfate adenylyltransferase subunit 2 [Alphaproteobacteria bacterium MarineAlpha9_Bin6]PPR37837.1 MAG: Sulfate adenylyltransferase subunit 2 [Alphaproteobacteria bacterium MarineAlpha9_Bin5]HHZ67916.1 sulfate adenylyltransferase subunit CysD [Alphaproteobacteria bacterium]HIA21426.1 sulfate adenylyltransferase subunit CysD [Alphaproteobacteria bacterium]HIB57269.1 sulfate adenylyltransferase subunit CysD [Alphaproteobacteria bacterium]
MHYLARLESESIYILREAYRTIHPLGMLWSLGKDSNVMLWLTRKAFLGRVPFPVVHVDTGKKFPEMYAFRDRYAEHWNLNLVCGECPPIETIDPSLPPAARSAARKTEGLKAIMDKEAFAGVFAGIRRDEQAVRAKERVFSPRGLNAEWDQHDQPAEFWGQYTTRMPQGSHIRIHPLLHWREIDIWRYTKRENIPIIDLYFSRNGYRYRSLGDQDITEPVKSSASTIDEVIAELETTKVAERAGRAMDHEDEDAFERLRQHGYM